MNDKRREVIEKLLEKIRDDSFVTKGRLPSERQISEMLGENRTIVREAIISLEAMGVIEIRERQGIFIASKAENEAKMLLRGVGGWPADTLSQVLELRQIIDPPAAAMAAIRRSDAHVEKLSVCIENMRGLLDDESPESADSGAYWNTVYHSVILEAAGNSYMARVYENILSTVEKSTSIMRLGTDSLERGGRHVSFAEHECLARAIKDKNSMTAERIAEEHLFHTISGMVENGQISPGSNLYAAKVCGMMRFE